MRRRLALVVSLAVGLTLLAWPAARGEYLGSDLVGNVSPQSQLGGGLVDRYPLSAYALDYHVDVGVTEPDGVPPMIAQWTAAQIWSVTSFLIKAVVDLFTWAFSLDLLAGDPGGGGGGALAPVAEAIAGLYENVIGEAWMVTAILIAGVWGIWKALVQRRYTETAGALAVSVAFVLIALFFVYQPERTIGQASQWTNTLSLAFLSGANRGSLDDPEQAKHQVADHLFDTLVYRPWVVLQFGGLRHCVDTSRLNEDGYPRPVGPHDPARAVCRDHLRPGRDGHGGYAPRFLRQPAGSEERTAEYDALRKGEAPSEPQFAGYRVDKADSPAVDIQQAGGAFQRLTFATVVFLGALGAVALLGFLSLAVILAQVVALVLLGFAPVALVIGIFPGVGHDFFRSWLAKLATAVFIKALYSLVIAIVVAVSAALTASTGSLGFLFAFGLQAIFFWAIFLYRKQITARLVSATTGAAAGERLPRMTVVQRGAHLAARPFSAMVGVGVGRLGARDGGARQESALAGATETPSGDGGGPDGTSAGRAPGAASANGHGPAPVGLGGNGHALVRGSPLANGNGHGLLSGSPLANGNGHGPLSGSRLTNGNGHSPLPGRPSGHGPTVGAGLPTSNGHAGTPNESVPGRLTPGDPLRTAGSAPNPTTPDRAPAAPSPSEPPARSPRHDESARPAAPPRQSAPTGEPASPPRREARRREATPRASHEDVMRRARELRERQRAADAGREQRDG